MYLDPGFGGMLVQVIVMVAAVSGGLLFALRRKIRKLFSKDKNKEQSQAADFSATDITDDAVDVLDSEQGKTK